MADSPTKLQRWLDIIAYLVGRRLPVSADELMSHVPAYAGRWGSSDRRVHESARRGFERDKDELRRLGIPIRTVRYTTHDAPDTLEAYIIERRDFYLPYLSIVQRLSGGPRYQPPARHRDVEIAEDEAPLALEALRRVADVPGFPFAREARSAFRKLAFDIDPQRFLPGEAVLFVDRPGAAELSDRLRVLSEALLARKRVRFRYHGIYRDAETARDVDGYGLLFHHGHWYLVGFDHTRDDTRVFRVGRMLDVEANTKAPRTPDYEIPQDFSLDDYMERQAWELGDQEEQPILARVRFRFPLSLWADRNGFGVVAERHADGAVTRTFDVHQVGPFLRWLLSLEGEAELLDPPHLRHELAALAADIAAAHEETAP